MTRISGLRVIDEGGGCMKIRSLRDIEVSEVGMGRMGFSHGYGQIPPEEYSMEAIRCGNEKCYQRTDFSCVDVAQVSQCGSDTGFEK